MHANSVRMQIGYFTNKIKKINLLFLNDEHV